MEKKLLMAILLQLAPVISIADCSPVFSQCYSTPLGNLEQKDRSDSDDGYSHLTLNGRDIYKAKTSYMVIGYDEGIFEGKKYLLTKAIISFVSDNTCFPGKPGPNCDINIVLDLTSKKPVLSNYFFSESNASHVTWVSWGKINAIIVIDDYLRFKYSNGHVERVTQEK